VAAVLALASAAVTGGVVSSRVRANVTSRVGFSPNKSVFERPGNVPAIAARGLKSVVTIQTVVPSCSSSALRNTGVSSDAGTGMVVSGAGEILTNNHVVALATSITVEVAGSSEPLRATLVGTDPKSDVALLHVAGLPQVSPVTFAPASSIVVGERVVAIGNALALSESEPSVTAGILSGERRRIKAGGDCAGTEQLTGLLQTQAAVNPGNSGGPLFDTDGRVVGMNTAAASSASNGAERAQNVGFAIPVTELRTLLPGLRTGGTTGRPHAFLGVEVEPLGAGLHSRAGVPVSSGADVVGIDPGGPAAGAGLRAGDVIVAVGGHAVLGPSSLAAVLSATPPGTTLSVSFYRGSSRLQRSIWLSSTPAPPST
jgi:putative serine protease PepD